MPQNVDFAIEHLQHEVVESLQAAAGAGIGGIARQRLELGLAPADDAVEPAGDDRMRPRHQHRRRKGLVEDHRLVAHLEDAGDLQAMKAGLRRLADLEGDAGMGDLDLFLDMQARR